MSDSSPSPDFFNHILELAESKLGIPKKTVWGILEEDDWSFIIKLNALIEQLFNYLLVTDIEEEYLAELIIGLNLQKKIHLAKKKKVIDGKIAKKFSFISTLRNQAAHNVLFKFFNSEDLEIEYLQKFSDTWIEQTLINGKKINGSQMAKENPKLTLFFETIGSLAMMSVNHQFKIFEAEKKRQQPLIDAQNEILKLFKLEIA